jgi:hypothetical protein
MSFFRTGGQARASAALPAARSARAPLKERLVAASGGQRVAAISKVTASRDDASGEWTEF